MAKRTITPEPCSAQEKSFPTRHLKVRKGSYDYQFLPSNHLQPYYAPEPVPWICIKGYWLKGAGFAVDTVVNVKVSFGCLVVKAVY